MRQRIARARRASPGSSPRLALAVALILMASVELAGTCRADGLIISAPDLTATAGSSGSFDVLLANTNSAGGASYDVAVDAFTLGLSGPLTANFTDASIATVAAPYIYVTSGTTQGAGPLSVDPFPNMSFTASDSEFASPGFRTLNPGDVFGLAHVSYSVSSSTASGLETLAFLNVSLSDINGGDISVATSNGSIQVGASAVPEPSGLILGTTATIIGAAVFLRRRRRRRAPAY